MKYTSSQSLISQLNTINNNTSPFLTHINITSPTTFTYNHFNIQITPTNIIITNTNNNQSHSIKNNTHIEYNLNIFCIIQEY